MHPGRVGRSQFDTVEHLLHHELIFSAGHVFAADETVGAVREPQPARQVDDLAQNCAPYIGVPHIGTWILVPHDRCPKRVQRRDAVGFPKRIPRHLQGKNGIAHEYADTGDEVLRGVKLEQPEGSGLDMLVRRRTGNPEVHLVGDLVPLQVLEPLVVRDAQVRREHCSSSGMVYTTTVALCRICQPGSSSD